MSTVVAPLLGGCGFSPRNQPFANRLVPRRRPRLLEYLVPSAVLDLRATSPRGVLAELCRPLARLPGVDIELMLEALVAREELGSTGIGDGVALPHCRSAAVPSVVATFGRSRAGVEFRAIDGKPSHVFFAVFAPERPAGPYLRALAHASTTLRDGALRMALMATDDVGEMYGLIQAHDDTSS